MLATQCQRIAACLRPIPQKLSYTSAITAAPQLLPSTAYAWSLGSQISHQRYLTKLEEIMKKLKHHLQEQEWPRLAHVDVGGISLELPIRAGSLAAKQHVRLTANLEYLAGLFDGDGSVVPQTNLSGCQLRLGQQVSNITILILLLNRFGGSIFVSSSGKGSKRPFLSWCVCGEAARSAASELHQHCVVKKEQLGIARSWPDCVNRRKACAAQLKALKKAAPKVEPSMAGQLLSWSYFTGFFDAEGCIRISVRTKNVQLFVSQRDAPILKAMQGFLLGQLPVGAHIQVRKQSDVCYFLEVSSRKVVLRILEEMLAHGLLVKRTTAEHVLSSIDASHEVLRGEEPKVKGNQNFLKRLDDTGCLRARNINILQTKCRRARLSGKVLTISDLNDQLAEAKLEHAILNLMTQIKRLRSEIAVLRLQNEKQLISEKLWCLRHRHYFWNHG